MPVETPDEKGVTAIAEDRPPKEDHLALPLLGDEVLIGVKEVEDVRVQQAPLRELLVKLLAKLVAPDDLAVLLVFVKVENHLRRVPVEQAALLVLDDLPFSKDEGGSIAVNNFGHDSNSLFVVSTA